MQEVAFWMQWQPSSLVTQAPAVVGAFYFFSHTNKSTNQPPIPGTIFLLAPLQGGVFYYLATPTGQAFITGTLKNT